MTITEAARIRDEAIDAAKAEFWRERAKLAAACQAKIDAANREFTTNAFEGLREPIGRAA